MKKRVKKNKNVDFMKVEMDRINVMENIVKCLNDDSCHLSSCEIRMYTLDAIGC